MEEIENSNRNMSGRGERDKLGTRPIYISPKVFSQNRPSKQISESDAGMADNISVVMPSPKLFGNEDKEEQIGQNRIISIIMSIAIWILYILGSLEYKSYPIGPLHFCDIAGNLLAIILVGYNVFKGCRLTFSDILTFYSIIFTAVFYIDKDQQFMYVANGLRSLRLLFPIFLLGSLKQIYREIKSFALRTYQPLLLFIGFLLFFAVFALHLFQGSIFYKCRPTSVPTQYYWPALDQELCGSRQCKEGYYCRSPYEFSMEALVNQAYTKDQYLNGNVRFEVINLALTSGYQIVCLNQWVQAFRVFKNAINPFICFIFFFFITLFYQTFSVVTFIGYLDIDRYQNQLQIKNQIQQNKSSDFDTQDYMRQRIKITTQQNYYYDSQKPRGCQQRIFLCLENIFYIMQIVLVSLFGYSNINQAVGILLGVFFIIWSIKIFFMLYNYITDQSKTNNNHYSLIFQIILYAITIADYANRIIMGTYLFQQPSMLTPLAHSLIILRIFSILLTNGFDLIFQRYAQIIIASLIKLIPLTVIYFVATIFFSITNFYREAGVDGQQSLLTAFKNITKGFSFSLNQSWIEMFYQKVPDPARNGLQGTYIMFIQLLVFQYFLSKVISSNLISTTFQHQLLFQDQNQQINQNSDNKSYFMWKKQSSIRIFCNFIFNNQKYQQLRQLLLLAYCIIIFIDKQIIGEDIFFIVTIVIDSLFILDLVLETISKCVFGQKSYTQNNFLIIAYLLVPILIAINWFRPFLTIILRTCQFLRIFPYLNYYQSFRTFRSIISSAYQIIIKYAIIVSIIVYFFMIILIIPKFKQFPQLPIGSVFYRSFLDGLMIVSQRQWNWKQLIGSQINAETYMLQLFILIGFYFFQFVVMPSLCIFLVFHMEEYWKRKDLKKYPGQNEEDIEKKKIQDYILSIQAEPNNKSQVNKNSVLYLLVTCQAYKSLQIWILFLGLCSMAFLWPSYTKQVRSIVASIQLIFLISEICLYIIQIIVYGFKKTNYLIEGILLLISIPGSIIMFIPPLQYSYNSQALKQIFLLLTSITSIRFFKLLEVVDSYKPFLNKLYKLAKELSGYFLFFFTIGILLSLLIRDSLKYNQPQFNDIVFSLHCSFVGILGGGISNQIFKSQDIQWQATIILIITTFVSLILKNLLYAFMIYYLTESYSSQLSFFKRKMRNFTILWQNFDPKGEGVTDFKNIYYFSKRILPFVSTTRSIANTFELRQNLFKLLRIPIYQYQQNQLQDKLYVISIHDAIFYFYKLSETLEKKAVRKNIFEETEFIQWRDKTLKVINQKIKKTDLNSESMYYILRLLPKLRNILKKLRVKNNKMLKR